MTTEAQAAAISNIVVQEWLVTTNKTSIIGVGDALKFNSDGQNNALVMTQTGGDPRVVMLYTVIENSPKFDSDPDVFGLGFKNVSGSNYFYFNFDFSDPDPALHTFSAQEYTPEEFTDADSFLTFIDLFDGTGENPGGGPKTVIGGAE